MCKTEGLRARPHHCPITAAFSSHSRVAAPDQVRKGFVAAL